MKRIAYLIGLTLCLMGCNKSPIDDSNNNPEDPQQEEEIVVRLGLGGEITFSESPLTKAAGSETSSKDIYAINVFYDKQKDGIIDDPYSYGLFDNVEDMIITLLSGYKYRFECTFVPNGKECSSFYYSDHSLDYTFSSNKISNKFYSERSLNNIYFGDCSSSSTVYSKSTYYSTSNYQSYYGPAGYDRYYGELSDYTPKAGDKVVIEMIRCVFGIKVIITGLSDGSLSLGKCFGSNYTIKTDGVARDAIRAFIDVFKCWKSYQDYSVTESMTINWTRGNGVTQNLGSQNITVKRNVLTTVNINLVGSSTNNSIGLDVKTGEMGNSTINININADGTIDTNVDPQH